MAKLSRAAVEEREQAIAKLRSWLKPGDTVCTILRHVSKSGMTRHIGLVIIKGGETLHPDYAAATALGWRQQAQNGAIIVEGCGMDMGFQIVYSLGRVLFPEGFGVEGALWAGEKVRKKRPATPEAAAAMVKQGYKFRGRNGDPSGWDNDGGYALTHRWL